MKFLSDEWVAALDARARTHALPASEAPLCVEFRVDDVRYHLVLRAATLRFVAGSAPSPDVSLSLDRDTAAKIAQGQLSAQTAFMNGALRIGGDTQALVRGGGALSACGELMHDLAETTDF